MSHSTDPWERREAERARLNKKQGAPRDLFDELQHNLRPLGLVLSLGVFLVAEVPSIPPTVRLFLALGATVALILLLISCQNYAEPLARYLRRWQTWACGACFLWGGISFLWAPDRSVAFGELVRLLAGASVYVFTSYALRDRRELGAALAGMILLGCGIAVYDIAHFAQKTGMGGHFTANNISILGTHESVGSLLALLLPTTLALGLTATLSERARLCAQAAALTLGFAWIMVRCRSAWLGGGIALLLLGYLLWRYPPMKQTKQKPGKTKALGRWFASPAALVIVALVAMALIGGLAPLLSRRAAGLLNPLEDGSLSARLTMWSAGLRMLSLKPLLGWGLGGFLVLQGRWSNLGDSPEEVTLYGTGHQNIAHNYYVQWAAETGLVGLFLFLCAALLLLFRGWQALVQGKDAWVRSLLIACLVGLAGALIEVVASPAFQFCGVWTIFWALAGILTALVRLSGVEPEPRAEYRRLGVLALGVALVCGGFLWAGKLLWSPRDQPRGTLSITELTRGPYHPGETVRWRAQYQDGWGKKQGSHPGARWINPIWFEQRVQSVSRPLASQSWSIRKEPFTHSDMLRGLSALTLQLPSGETGLVQVQTVFEDEFGRTYSASRVVEVLAPTLPPTTDKQPAPRGAGE